MAEKRWMTTSEASTLLGKTDRQVRRYCRDKSLVCKKEGKQILVDADSVEALLQKNIASDSKESAEGERDVRSVSEAEGSELDATDTSSSNDVDGQFDVRSINSKVETEDHLPKLPREISKIFKQLRKSVASIQREEQKHHQFLCQTIEELEHRLRFEQGRNEKMQGALTELLNQLRSDPGDVRKVS